MSELKKPLWSSELWISSRSAVGLDGSIYSSPSYDGFFYAFDKNGSRRWLYRWDPDTHPNRFRVAYAVMLLSDGRVASACAVDGTDGYTTKLFVLTPDGRLDWEITTKGCYQTPFESIAEGVGGIILFCTPGKDLWAISPSGKKLWSFKAGGKLATTPRIGRDGTIYVGASDKKLYAISQEGKKKWEFFVGGRELRRFCLGGGGSVILNTFNGDLIVLNEEGQVQLRGINLDSQGCSGSPLVGSDRSMSTCTFDAIHSVKPSGEIKWSYRFAENSELSNRVLAADGTVLVAVRSGLKLLGDSSPPMPPSIVAIGANGQLSWDHQVDAKTISGLILTQDCRLIVTTDVGTHAFECPSGLADSPWPMDAQNPQRTSRANPKFNQPVEYGNRGAAAGLPVEIRSAAPARPIPDKPFSREEILEQLDANADFPMLDNGYLYLATARLSAYRDTFRWAIVIEIVGWNNHAAGQEGIENALYCYGNWLNQKPGLAEDGFLHMTRDGDEGTTFDGEYVDPDAKTFYVRDQKVKVPRSKRHYAALGIERQEPDTLMSHELLRVLVAEHRDLFLATEEELRQRVSADLPLILRLDEWRHPDMSAGEKPSQTKTFQMLAEVLIAGDPARYQPTEPPNTHWKHWPMGGEL